MKKVFQDVKWVQQNYSEDQTDTYVKPYYVNYNVITKKQSWKNPKEMYKTWETQCVRGWLLWSSLKNRLEGQY